MAAYRVRVALALKGVAVREIAVDLDAGEQFAPDFLAVNPEGAVPALIEAGQAPLTQSMAILEYLEERYPDPPLLPADPHGRARVRSLAAAGRVATCADRRPDRPGDPLDDARPGRLSPLQRPSAAALRRQGQPRQPPCQPVRDASPALGAAKSCRRPGRHGNPAGAPARPASSATVGGGVSCLTEEFADPSRPRAWAISNGHRKTENTRNLRIDARRRPFVHGFRGGSSNAATHCWMAERDPPPSGKSFRSAYLFG